MTTQVHGRTGPRRMALLGGVAMTLLAAGAAAIPVTVSESRVRALASGASGSVDTAQTLNTAVPFSGTLVAADGASSNTTTVSWIGDAASVSFDFAFEHAVDNSAGPVGEDFARTWESVLVFTPLADLAYAISGAYSFDIRGGGRATSDVQLYTTDTAVSLFQDFAHSSFSDDGSGSHVAGAPGGGTFGNVDSGAASGVLAAGQAYTFYFNQAVLTRYHDGTGFVATTGSGTASGALRLDLGVLAVPSPAPGLLLLAGWLALATRRLLRP